MSKFESISGIIIGLLISILILCWAYNTLLNGWIMFGKY